MSSQTPGDSDYDLMDVSLCAACGERIPTSLCLMHLFFQLSILRRAIACLNQTTLLFMPLGTPENMVKHEQNLEGLVDGLITSHCYVHAFTSTKACRCKSMLHQTQKIYGNLDMKFVASRGFRVNFQVVNEREYMLTIEIITFRKVQVHSCRGLWNPNTLGINFVLACSDSIKHVNDMYKTKQFHKHGDSLSVSNLFV